MKKQLPVFKWTPTEWDVLYALHESTSQFKDPYFFLQASLKLSGHKMSLHSIQGEISAIRKKMYEYSKHLGSSKKQEELNESHDAVVKSQKLFYEEIINHIRKDLEIKIKSLESERDHLSMTITEDRALWKEQEDWKKKYEELEKGHKEGKSWFFEHIVRYNKQIKALEDQCKKADEIIQAKNKRIDELDQQKLQLWADLQGAKMSIWMRKFNLFEKCAGVLVLLVAIGYALLVLRIIHV